MEVNESFKHCPRCKGQFTKKTSYLQCNNCGLYFYINPKPCTSTVLTNQKAEILLVERSVDPGKGLWDFPGGFVEEGESFEENATREINEELGIEVTEFNYVRSATEPYLFQNVIYPTLTVCFIARLPENVEMKAADDVASFKLFPLDKLPSDKFAFGSMLTAVPAVKKYLKTHNI